MTTADPQLDPRRWKALLACVSAQRLGAAAGTAVLSAVPYAGAAGVAGHRLGATRSLGYAHAYVLSLAVAVVVALAALTLAVRDVWGSAKPVAPLA